MRFAKLALAAVVALLLGVYGFDCEAMTTPEQAMQCCGSMPCSPHGHDGQDCCRTMPTMHVPFVKPSAVPASFHLAIVASLAMSHFPIAGSGDRMTTSVFHAPSIFSPPTVSPLRI